MLIPLAAGCILALERRRWLLAGALAGVATATGADALALTVVCAISAAVMVYRHGPRDREALRSLLAPLLSLVGIAAFANLFVAVDGNAVGIASGSAHRLA